MPKVTWQFLEGRSQHLSPLLPQMFSAKAIPGCYLFTRNVAFLCTRFRKSQSDPKDPINIQRFFSVVVFWWGGFWKGVRQHQTLRFRSSSQRGRCMRLGRETGCPHLSFQQRQPVSKQRVEPVKEFTFSRGCTSPHLAGCLHLCKLKECIPGPNWENRQSWQKLRI